MYVAMPDMLIALPIGQNGTHQRPIRIAAESFLKKRNTRWELGRSPPAQHESHRPSASLGSPGSRLWNESSLI